MRTPHRRFEIAAGAVLGVLMLLLTASSVIVDGMTWWSFRHIAIFAVTWLVVMGLILGVRRVRAWRDASRTS